MENPWIILSLALIYGCLYLGSNWVLMYLKYKNKLKDDPKPTIYPSVSVIIPAYNAEKTIAQCIESVLALKYPKKIQTIVIDDGSADSTGKIAKKYPVDYIWVKHGGKSHAMNVGIKKTKGELVATLDSDSFVTPDTLLKMVGYLEQPDTAAVIPVIKIYNNGRMLEKLQNIEYLYGAFLRKLFTFLNSLFVVPGPFSLFKKGIFKKLGGFDENNLTEDMEMGLRILDAGYQIQSSLNAEVYTVAPDRLKNLINQRIRWYIGNLRNIITYRHVLFKLNDLSMVLITSIFSIIILLLAMVLLTRGSLIFANTYLNLGKGYLSLGPGLDFAMEKFFSFEYSFNILNFYLPGVIFTLIFLVLMALCLSLCFSAVNEKFKLGPEHLLYATVYSVLLGVMWATSLLKELVNKVRGDS